MEKLARAVVILGLALALAFVAAAFFVGGKLRTIGDNTQKIIVKGLAEKPVTADFAEWSVGIEVKGEDFGKTLALVRETRPVLTGFLEKQGFPAAALEEGNERVQANYVEEYDEKNRYRRVQRGFTGYQSVLVKSNDLPKITAAHKAVIELAAAGNPVTYSDPSYLVSDLEGVKMSLIGAATQNARARADEFARVGQVKVGRMRAASQGAFYILSNRSDAAADDYGGVYDKSTVDKKARVVVTIEYGID